VAVSGLSSGVVAIAAGGAHTCAILTGGGLKCWGDNSFGQLGDGTKTNRLTPVAVSGLSSGVIAVSGGNVQTCALASGGAVKCWGLNNTGQLGDGTTTDHITPAPVSGLTSGVTAITARQGYACALTAAGGVKCWGTNEYGQLGNGTTINQLMPLSVSGLNSGVAAISSGSSHACALTIGGAVKCWGSNRNGQLGIDPGWMPVTVNGFGLDHKVFSPLIQQR
jgi:alpha-tubulin suppressor-like RCC1 family protein